ncbi:Ribosomal large subunit pseudouridine synthase B [Gossypium arboreum]|uniref:Ribosomal large subunit pseudouridine synthase B n=1 Tax=Gossypium arboreum TaxID=29729 RepID=A0A0B0PLM2_GOSAR|nr:Ribosomal large subunit pseudouridine synthase B [Gossypium arboreum]
MLVLYILPVAEYTGICCEYLTACCANFPSIRYCYSEWFMGKLCDGMSMIMRPCVAKLAQIGDCRDSNNTIKLSFGY